MKVTDRGGRSEGSRERWRELCRRALERSYEAEHGSRYAQMTPAERAARLREIDPGPSVQEELARLQARYDELEGKIRQAERAAPAAASPPSREYATRSGSRPLAQHSVEFRRWAEGALRAHRNGVVWPAWRDVKSGKAKLP